eukprot:Gb_02068 [translate_table: standard]
MPPPPPGSSCGAFKREVNSGTARTKSSGSRQVARSRCLPPRGGEKGTETQKGDRAPKWTDRALSRGPEASLLAGAKSLAVVPSQGPYGPQFQRQGDKGGACGSHPSRWCQVAPSRGPTARIRVKRHKRGQRPNSRFDRLPYAPPPSGSSRVVLKREVNSGIARIESSGSRQGAKCQHPGSSPPPRPTQITIEGPSDREVQRGSRGAEDGIVHLREIPPKDELKSVVDRVKDFFGNAASGVKESFGRISSLNNEAEEDAGTPGKEQKSKAGTTS